MADNTITVVGNVTREPELKFANSGTAIGKFSVAVTKKGYDGREDETSFFEVVTFGSLAENVASSITKGGRVIVSGALSQRSWETEKGEKRSAVEIKADAVGPDLRWAAATVAKTDRTYTKSVEAEDPF